MKLNDFYLVKCFETAEYRDSFNDGSNIYINSTRHFWNLENTFQKDREGLLFQQTGKGYIIKAKPGFEKIVEESSSSEEIKRRAVEEGVGEVVCGITDTSARLEGYICCFYLLPKSEVSFTGTTLSILSEDERKDIAYFLEKYLEETDNKDFYVSIYDANIFCKVFCSGMLQKGYGVTVGIVDYKDVDISQRIKWWQEGNYNSIVFTKPTDYRYQKEFRIFLTKEEEHPGEHISENGIEIYKSILGSFDYTMILQNNKS